VRPQIRDESQLEGLEGRGRLLGVGTRSSGGASPQSAERGVLRIPHWPLAADKSSVSSRTTAIIHTGRWHVGHSRPDRAACTCKKRHVCRDL